LGRRGEGGKRRRGEGERETDPFFLEVCQEAVPENKPPFLPVLGEEI